ncbi:hypothetical protein FHR72_001131 [Mycolicibacterium iranicum]|uniref:Uncharacterized protein n=1 Tax=Mycolicibacterium iranicum TaxID=912594 RepID=A0A839PZX5_MYCIR|nr:hypothetical protein [Mycolicibacterium iranicum]MBB2989668.1 hypothetical protein [Mycolicibacterium iranicum]
MLVLGTDPASVLTVLARIGDEPGGILNLSRFSADVVDLTTLAMLLDLPHAFTRWRLDDDDAERVILALHESRVHGRPSYRWGHSSVVAARTLLHSDGDCDGCGTPIDLSGHDAVDNVHVHTADPVSRPDPEPPIRTADTPGHRWPYAASLRSAVEDWPAVLCRSCHRRIGDTSFVAYKFAQHPACPECGGARTQSIGYGMPADPDAWGPWLYMGGCILKSQKWHCGFCDHTW